MGVFKRPDSPYYWLWLEKAPKGQQKEATDIRIGETVSQRKDSKALAQHLYHKRMTELASKIHRLVPSQIPSRFDNYAKTYATDVISHHRGGDRELEMLKPLLAFFGHDELATIDQERVRQYMTKRRHAVVAVTVNREIDLLKAMLRDAVPKYLERSPLVGMKRLPVITNRKRLLQPEEEERLLAVATDPQDYAILVLGIDAMVRLGDLLDLRRVDRDDVWITIRHPKSGEPYMTPLTPRAVAALDAITHDKPYYFDKFRRALNARDWRGSVRQRLEYLCRLAHVPFGPGGITFHGATRKTGATRLLVEKGISVAIVQALGNWKRPDVLLGIYTEAQRKDLLVAVGQTTPKKSPKAASKNAVTPVTLPRLVKKAQIS
jgi:integrase